MRSSGPWSVGLLLLLGLAPRLDAGQPALRSYSIRDGLPYSQVFCVLQDRRGFLWAGTSYGLARYDGREFVTVDKARGLPHDSVLSVAEDEVGTVWVLTQAGLARISPSGGPHGAPRPVPLPDSVRSLATGGLTRLAASGPALWLAGAPGLFRYRDGTLERVPLPDGLRGSDVSWLGPVTADQAWLVASGRVALLGPERTPSVFAAPAAHGPAVATVRSGDEVLLVARDGVSSLGGSGFVVDPRFRLPASLNPSGAASHDGGLVVLTPGRGAWLLPRQGEPRNLGREEGLLSDSVHAAVEDRDGLLWLATENGLVKVLDLAITVYPRRPGRIGETVLSFAPDGGGGTWIGHDEGVTLASGDGATLLDPLPGSAEDRGVWAVLALGPGEALVATKTGISRVGRGGAQRVPGLPLAGRGRVYDLHRDRNGFVWASTDDGVVRFRWEGGRQVDVLLLSESGGEPVGEVRGVDSFPSGEVWFGTDGGGLLRWDGSQLRRLGAADGLPTGVCRTVLCDGEVVWIGTDAGLFRWRAGRIEPVPLVGDRLGRPYVVALAPGRDGAVWVALTDRLAELRDDRVVSVLDRATGLAFESTTAENCLLADASGRLWAGLVGGAVVIDLDERRREWPLPDVVLLGAWDGAGNAILPRALVPHGRNTITFAYRSPTFVAEEATRFQERLVGYDRDWSPPHAEPGQRYTNLPAGSYALEVRAVSLRGESPSPSVLRFSVGSPWWATPTALTGFTAALVTALAGAVAWRTRTLRHRALVLAARVAERTRELAGANERLREAQRRVDELLASGAKAQEDVAAWAGAAASEIARTVGAREISVLTLDAERPSLLTGSSEVALGADLLARLGRGETVTQGHDRRLVPAAGASGELLAVLVVDGLDPGDAGAAERLVLAFAQQLGGALEMRKLRRRLADAEAARSLVRQSLLERGVETVALCPACGVCRPAGAPTCAEDGATLVTEGLLPLAVKGRYRLRRLLGEGGMGRVFLADDEKLGREVALKLVRPERFDDPSVRLRFEREARAAARIQHPGVVALFDSGALDDGSLFLVLERLRGTGLEAALERWGRPSASQAARVLSQASSALAAAHRSGIVHRDVKPGNLFLVPDGDDFRVKALDFGLARPLGPAAGLTRTGMVVGTPAYMAPEQVRGEPATPRTDLYSLAVVGWELLTGSRLVVSEALGTIFQSILADPAPAPSLLRPGLPPAVDAALAGALAKDPSTRPPDLEAWAASFCPVLAASPPDGDAWPEPVGPALETDGQRAGTRTLPAGGAPAATATARSSDR